MQHNVQCYYTYIYGVTGLFGWQEVTWHLQKFNECDSRHWLVHGGDSITVLDLVEAEGEGEAAGELLDGLEGLARPVNCWTLLLQQFCVQLQQDTAGVKHDTAGVKHNTAGVKHNTAGVKHNTAGVKYNSAGIKHDTAGAKHDSTGVRERHHSWGQTRHSRQQLPHWPWLISLAAISNLQQVINSSNEYLVIGSGGYLS